MLTNEEIDMPFYRKKDLQEMIPWEPGMPIDNVSISNADRMSGSPKEGDMTAINKNDPLDQWLVEKKFYEDNYEWVSDL